MSLNLDQTRLKFANLAKEPCYLSTELLPEPIYTILRDPSYDNS